MSALQRCGEVGRNVARRAVEVVKNASSFTRTAVSRAAGSLGDHIAEWSEAQELADEENRKNRSATCSQIDESGSNDDDEDADWSDDWDNSDDDDDDDDDDGEGGAYEENRVTVGDVKDAIYQVEGLAVSFIDANSGRGIRTDRGGFPSYSFTKRARCCDGLTVYTPASEKIRGARHQGDSEGF